MGHLPYFLGMNMMYQLKVGWWEPFLVPDMFWSKANSQTKRRATTHIMWSAIRNPHRVSRNLKPVWDWDFVAPVPKRLCGQPTKTNYSGALWIDDDLWRYVHSVIIRWSLLHNSWDWWHLNTCPRCVFLKIWAHEEPWLPLLDNGKVVPASRLSSAHVTAGRWPMVVNPSHTPAPQDYYIDLRWEKSGI